MTDAGRSGFSRKDWATYALAQFVEHVKSRRVQAGSYLLVENLDRLSREDLGTATELLLTLVNRGVVVVQLSPVATEFRKPVNLPSLMLAAVELSRQFGIGREVGAHGRRVAAKQKEAGTKVVTKVLPGWIDYTDGKLTVNPEKAADGAARIQARARWPRGHGDSEEAQRRRRAGDRPEGVQGPAVKWANTTVYYILTTRR